MREELQEVETMKGEVERVRENMARLQAKLQTKHFDLDRQEQYSRKDSVRIYGIPEAEDERETNDIVVKLAKDIGVNITTADLSVSHRLGRRGRWGKPRTIIAKFVRRQCKTDVMRNKSTFCGQTLTSVTSHCYLSIHLSNTLNWTNQTKVASTKPQQTLGAIRRNLNKCPTHIKAVAYTSLVRPILEYASAAWDPHSQNNIITIERIQRQAARFCKNNYSREPGSVTKLLQELGWETLQARRKHKRITTLYKMEHNIIDIPLDQ